MLFARQSTARIVTVGPVLDADGVAVTGGVVADFKISKNGGIPAALNASATLTHRHTGHYSLSLTTSDLDTVGTAEVVIDDTVNACPPKEISVVEEVVYDALFAASATGLLPANVTQWLGTAAATPTIAGVPEVDVTHWIGTAVATPTVAGVPEVDITHLVGVAQSATDLKDFADAGYDPATNKVQGVVLVDTLTTYTGNTVQTGDSFARIGATGSGLTTLASQASVNTVDDFLDTEIAAILAAVDTEVAAIKTVTDLLPNAGALTTYK